MKPNESKFIKRYKETELLRLIRETDFKEEEISRILGGIQIVRPLVIGAVGGQQIAKPVEILLYKERISIFLHHLFIFNKTIDADLSKMQLEIDIAQWETGPIFPSEREKIDYFSVTEAGSFLGSVK